MRVERRRALIEPGHGQLSVVRQCELVSISRSSFYYQPVGETAENLALMRLIDARFLGAVDRQRVHRAAVAQSEICVRLPARIRDRLGADRRALALHRLLEPR